MTAPKEIASWDDVGDAITGLAGMVVDSAYEPDIVLGIARGGAGLGALVAHRLGVKAFVSINVEYYSGTGMDDVRLPEPVLVGSDLHQSDFLDKSVLIVDDIAETGETLRFVTNLVGPLASETRSAAWYLKPGSVVKPDYWLKETDLWIVAPWNPASPTVAESNQRLAL